MLPSLLIAAVVGYLLGSLPFGYLVARSRGVNIFEVGSKNPGATNVRRVLGSGPGNLVFFLDALKGAIAAGWPLIHTLWSVRESEHVKLSYSIVVSHSAVPEMAVTGLVSALIGHSFSCFTKFRGGKGVATATGGLLILMPTVLLIGVALWVVTFYATRYVSLASIFAAVSLPVSGYFLGASRLLLAIAALIAVFVVLRHRTNIQRLLAGTETKFVKKPKAQLS